MPAQRPVIPFKTRKGKVVKTPIKKVISWGLSRKNKSRQTIGVVQLAPTKPRPDKAPSELTRNGRALSKWLSKTNPKKKPSEISAMVRERLRP